MHCPIFGEQTKSIKKKVNILWFGFSLLNSQATINCRKDISFVLLVILSTNSMAPCPSLFAQRRILLQFLNNLKAWSAFTLYRKARQNLG
jgi:hypothetical protein